MASGDTCAAWSPFHSNEPPSENAAVVGTLIPTGDATRYFVRFPSSGSPRGVVSGKMLSYGGGGVNVRIRGSMDGANTGTKVVRMEVALERLPSEELLTGNGFASGVAAEGTVDNTARNLFTVTVPLTHGAQMDSVVNGDWFRLRYTRLNSGLTGENASGTFDVLHVDIVEA